MLFNFKQTNFDQTKTFKFLLEYTLSEMTGEHYIAKPRGLIKLSANAIKSYERYLVNFHGDADFKSVDEFFLEVKRGLKKRIKNCDDELELFKFIMNACKKNMKYNQSINNHLEKIRLEKEIEAQDDYSPGL